MEITWYGLSCFRLTDRGATTIVVDPYSPKLGLPALKLKADVVTVSHDAPGHNDLTGISQHKHVLTGPGEYEIGGTFVTGISTQIDANSPENILYVFDYDGLTIAHLGDISQIPNKTQLEALEQINVLLIPVGGGKTLSSAQAAELVSMIEPNIVIPMHYEMPNLSLSLDSVERFTKEMGANDITVQSSLKVSLSNLPEETELVLLEAKI